MAETTQTTQPVSEREIEIALSGSAVAVNKFFIFVQDGGVRIAFTEQFTPEKEAHFRTAVMLPYQDAINLADVLKEMLAPIEAEILAARSKKGA